MTTPAVPYTAGGPGAARNVRNGPASLFTLVVILCLAVLAVLAASTAQATLLMSQRLAVANQEFYLAEEAGQTLLAGLDGALGEVRDGAGAQRDAAQAVEMALPEICENARQAVDGKADIAATFEGGRVNVEITCHNGRTLKASIAILDDATYRIDRWKTTAVENEEQPTGTLWTGA